MGASLLGGGLLERARSTTLALLGLTAAVGLAMVAIALNQGWPLVAGNSIPLIPPRHQDIGEATVVAGPTGGDVSKAPKAVRRARSNTPGGGTGTRAEEGSPPAPAPSESTELVVAPAAATKPQDESPKHIPAPAEQPPEAVAEPPTAASPSKPASPPSSTPAPAPAPTPDSATASEAPVDSNVPSWSHGNGHAYGREKHANDLDSGYSDDSDGCHDDAQPGHSDC
jgi:outer membrane biosynthesis protein TonB